MNLCIITARILSQPRLLRREHKAFIYFFIGVPNNKKGLSLYKIKIYSRGNTAKEVYSLYRKRDFITLEGFIYMKSKKIKSENLKIAYKLQKFIVIKVNTVYPQKSII
uniref:Single-stranded DNA binding protein n=1 Tax=Inkyuleea mariana TaxID=123988 RepID=A0A4D6X6V6_9FLOR|nr:hypothetical protein [Inkyuleea mariana]